MRITNDYNDYKALLNRLDTLERMRSAIPVGINSEHRILINTQISIGEAYILSESLKRVLNISKGKG